MPGLVQRSPGQQTSPRMQSELSSLQTGVEEVPPEPPLVADFDGPLSLPLLQPVNGSSQRHRPNELAWIDRDSALRACTDATS